MDSRLDARSCPQVDATGALGPPPQKLPKTWQEFFFEWESSGPDGNRVDCEIHFKTGKGVAFKSSNEDLRYFLAYRKPDVGTGLWNDPEARPEDWNCYGLTKFPEAVKGEKETCQAVRSGQLRWPGVRSGEFSSSVSLPY